MRSDIRSDYLRYLIMNKKFYADCEIVSAKNHTLND